MSVSFGINGHVVTVDAEDLYAALSGPLRIVDKTRHKRRKLYVEHCWIDNGKFRHRALHRFILGMTDSAILVDHIDGNGLNNVRSNLRLATRRQNAHNTVCRADSKSGIKGVRERNGKFQANITKNGKMVYLGSWKDIELARAAYLRASAELHGEFQNK